MTHMTTNDPNDVAAILEMLRAEVHARRVAQGDSSQDTALSAVERELRHCAEQLEITRVVSAHWPLESRSFYERAVNLVNKVVRRGLRWYINPIVEQQNGFNETVTRVLHLMIEAHAELRDQYAELRRKVDLYPASPEDAGSGTPPAFEESTVPSTAELQQLVERAGRGEPPAVLSDLGLRPVSSLIAQRQEVSAHLPLTGNTPLTKARALAQRAIRQYLRWMINPIVEQQNGYNASLAGTVQQLLIADGELRAHIAALRARKA